MPARLRARHLDSGSASAPGALARSGTPSSQPAQRHRPTAPDRTAPPKPPPVRQAAPPKRYVLAAGTPISVRTLSEVNTKAAKSGNEFEATLESALVADGHTLAKRGATVVGQVVNADQGGRVKGKASLTLALARLRLANGQTVGSKPIPWYRKPRAEPERT